MSLSQSEPDESGHCHPGICYTHTHTHSELTLGFSSMNSLLFLAECLRSDLCSVLFF